MANKTSSDIQIKDLDSWKRGQISYFSDSRMQEDALKTAYNVIFDYDAIVRPRGSFNESTIPDLPEGLAPLGCDFAFKRADDTEGLLNVFTDGTDAWLFVLDADGEDWTKFDSIVYDPESRFSFAQIADVVVLGNGVDSFSYYDIGDGTHLQLTEVTDPVTAPTATPAL
jgi:hypothetical protein